jgi:hypothetical protein
LGAGPQNELRKLGVFPDTKIVSLGLKPTIVSKAESFDSVTGVDEGIGF